MNSFDCERFTDESVSEVIDIDDVPVRVVPLGNRRRVCTARIGDNLLVWYVLVVCMHYWYLKDKYVYISTYITRFTYAQMPSTESIFFGGKCYE